MTEDTDCGGYLCRILSGFVLFEMFFAARVSHYTYEYASLVYF